ncbi:hypothetical protein BDZ85DRAFT_264678 [Elsinoe ampelina]|uniref:Uncharacterized protein n=1 Tax=Elsinoe ampelina TaxID=302913 RepID=A0A6A6G8H0_9PEZI|nr:hypothetical protein BDZ85DRAFT_264678 [Elsinoe ampelina]
MALWPQNGHQISFFDGVSIDFSQLVQAHLCFFSSVPFINISRSMVPSIGVSWM